MSILLLRDRRGKDGKYIKGSVYRRSVEPFDHHGRRVVVGLEPGDVITFREEGCRKTYSIDIRWAYRQAVKKAVEKEKAEKRAAKGLKPRRRRVRRSMLR